MEGTKDSDVENHDIDANKKVGLALILKHILHLNISKLETE